MGDDWVRKLFPERLAGKSRLERTVYAVEPDFARVLALRTPADITAFAKQYGRPEHGPEIHVINWDAVREAGHSGIEIAPFQPSLTSRRGYEWLEGWEVASGVVWAPQHGLRSLKAIGTIDAQTHTFHAEQRVEEARSVRASLAEIRGGAPTRQVAAELLWEVERGVDWRGKHIWHGTSAAGAQHIKKHGVKVDKSVGGYFGWGFYAADDPGLAKANYADFADDEGEEGVVLEFKIKPRARILDLRSEKDWLVWRDSGYAKRVNDSNLHTQLVRAGIDGLYDESFGGVVIYNPKAIEFVKVHRGSLQEAVSASSYLLTKSEKIRVQEAKEPWQVRRDAFVKQARKAGKKTAVAAQSVVQHAPGKYQSFLVAGQESLESLENGAWSVRISSAPANAKRQFFDYAVAVLRGSKGTTRILAFHQPMDRELVAQDIVPDELWSVHSIKGGLFIRDGKILDAWVDQDVRGARGKTAHGSRTLLQVLLDKARKLGYTETEGPFSADALGASAKHEHRLAVAAALKHGKKVPPEVRADYPDLEESVDTVQEGRENFKGPSLPEAGYPHPTVLLYRAQGEQAPPRLKYGDFVTQSRKFAVEHAEHNVVVEEEPQVVIRAVVPARDVFEAPNPGELLYFGHGARGTVVHRVAPPAEESAGRLPSLKDVQRLLPQLAKAAQKEYDAWDPNDEDGDADLGFGGICDRVAEELAQVLGHHGVETALAGQDGDDHAWLVIQVKEGVYSLDIPPSVYETGGGYRWKKRKGVHISAHDVELHQLEKDPAKFDRYTDGS